MVEQMVGASNQLAQNVVKVTGEALDRGKDTSSG
jgi:hypothetical protein